MAGASARSSPVGDVHPAPKPWVLWTAGLVGLSAVAASVVLGITSDQDPPPGVRVVLLNWIVVSYIVGGLTALWRRPDSRFGPLMVVAGFGTWLSTLSWANSAVLFTIGQAADLLPVVLFLHVFLSFPTGRLGGRWERAIVIAGYVMGVGSQLVVMLLGGFGPDNVLAVVTEPDAANVVHNVQLIVISGLCLAVVGVLAVHRRTGGPPLRRSVSLLVDSFALVLVTIAVLLLSGAFNGPAFVTIQRITLVVIGVAPIAFLAGLLDARLARTAVGDLLVRLRAEPDRADLRGLLSGALRDPSLELAYWLPQFESWADEEGRPVELPVRDGGSGVTLIDRDGVQVAALVHDPALEDEPELLEAVCAAAAIALENGRLRAELIAHLDGVRESRARVIEAAQQERQRLERDLHDGAQQRLIALSLDISLLESKLEADPDTKAGLAQAKREIAMSLDELRDVARGLHPAVLSGHGLQVALESLAARASVPVRLAVRLDGDGRLAERVEVTAYYVVCECLANIAKHAEATSAGVEVARTAERLVVEVADDGVGGADPERGTGLRGLADRVEAIDGRLRVWTPRGGGTRVRAEIPCG
jgi:signal transduction histidine kinase